VLPITFGAARNNLSVFPHASERTLPALRHLECNGPADPVDLRGRARAGDSQFAISRQ